MYKLSLADMLLNGTGKYEVTVDDKVISLKLGNSSYVTLEIGCGLEYGNVKLSMGIEISPKLGKKDEYYLEISNNVSVDGWKNNKNTMVYIAHEDTIETHILQNLRYMVNCIIDNGAKQVVPTLDAQDPAKPSNIGKVIPDVKDGIATFGIYSRRDPHNDRSQEGFVITVDTDTSDDFIEQDVGFIYHPNIKWDDDVTMLVKYNTNDHTYKFIAGDMSSPWMTYDRANDKDVISIGFDIIASNINALNKDYRKLLTIK